MTHTPPNPYANPGNPRAGQRLHTAWTVATAWLANGHWRRRTDVITAMTEHAGIKTKSAETVLRDATNAGALEIQYREPNHHAYIRLAQP